MSVIVAPRSPRELGIESILFSKTSLDSRKTDSLLSIETDNFPKPGVVPSAFSLVEELGTLPVFLEIDVFQYNSSQNSLDQFVAKEYRQIPNVLAIYRERDGERLYFHILTADDEERTLEQVFEPEKFFYTRFPTEELDFQVLPGRELESCIPSAAILLWQR